MKSVRQYSTWQRSRSWESLVLSHERLLAQASRAFPQEEQPAATHCQREEVETPRLTRFCSFLRMESARFILVLKQFAESLVLSHRRLHGTVKQDSLTGGAVLRRIASKTRLRLRSQRCILPEGSVCVKHCKPSKPRCGGGRSSKAENPLGFCKL